MKLVLIRHPQPQIDAGICYGKTDLLLREAAELCAIAIYQRLCKSQSIGLSAYQAPSHIACSPLYRCKQLGLALAQLQTSATLSFDDRLQELNFGTWEMERWDSIGKARMDAWIASNFDAHHGGESLQALDARVASWLNSTKQQQVPNQTLTEPTIWAVTHAGVIRSVLRQQGVCSFEASLSWPIDYGQFIELNLE